MSERYCNSPKYGDQDQLPTTMYDDHPTVTNAQPIRAVCDEIHHSSFIIHHSACRPPLPRARPTKGCCAPHCRFDGSCQESSTCANQIRKALHYGSIISSSIVSNVNSAERFAGNMTRFVPCVRAEGTSIPSRPRVAMAPPMVRHRRRLSVGRSAREPHRSAPFGYGRPAAILPASDSAKTARAAPHRVQRTRRAHQSSTRA
jgi:hypothetical protein